jgi:hypothetical protein
MSIFSRIFKKTPKEEVYMRSFMEMVNLVIQLANNQSSPDRLADFVTRHPDLLSDEADSIIRRMVYSSDLDGPSDVVELTKKAMTQTYDLLQHLKSRGDNH